MVDIGARLRAWQKMRDETPELEQLGFCPKDKTAMMFYYILSNDEGGAVGRICPECGYDSPYHQDVLSTFLEEVDKVKITEIVIGHFSNVVN